MSGLGTRQEEVLGFGRGGVGGGVKMAFVLPVTGGAVRRQRAVCLAKGAPASRSGSNGFGKKAGCACGSDVEYEKCCGALHEKKKKADRAEEVMRARYVAYKKGIVDFIMETTIGVNDMESTPKWREALDLYMKTTKFEKLKILGTEKGGPEDDDGYVRFEVTTNAGSYIERSHFLPNDTYGWAYKHDQQLQ